MENKIIKKDSENTLKNMITDKEIQRIFDWADENNINGKRVATTKYKWGIDVNAEEFKNKGFETIRQGIPRDKELIKHITHLNLSAMKLKSMPDEIFKLEKLTHLNISRNYFTDLSKEIFRLKNLVYLNILNNQIKTIPKEIGKLEKLEKLNLSDNNLIMIPETIANLVKLTILYIGHNYKLKELPKEIANLVALKELDLSNCAIKELPKEIDNLVALKELDLGGCSTKELPKEIGNLVALEKLNLCWCKNLKELPKEIDNLVALKELDLGGCSTKELPKEIGNLVALKELDLSDCKIKELPKEIGNLVGLEKLNLCWCKNLKELPKEIGNLVALKELDLSNCAIKELPKEIDNLVALKELDLGGCSIKELPKEIGNLVALEKLNLCWCKNLKELPKEIDNLVALKELDLGGCSTKELPKEIGNLVALKELDLSDCKIKELPKEIGNLVGLEKLNLCWCKNLKELPKEIGNLVALKELDLRSLGIDKLPDEFSNLVNLERLNDEPFILLNKTTQSNNQPTITTDNKFISKENFGNFSYKNILLKGVPGTGKSRAIENIINYKLKLENHKENILRINIHSASSNADLMQGIGISSKNGQIEYKEKQGLILNLIQRATFNPNQPFVLVLEEIQENSLNELIGDLIYLIEDVKRAKNIVVDDGVSEYQELVNKIVTNNPKTAYVEIPYLVNNSTEYRKMVMPNNFYIFCTSNYRDDKKVIEDNLLRRFEVLEIYPKYKRTIGDDFKSQKFSDFLEELNNNILEVMKDEIHPDRFLIGHSNWLEVDSYKKFYRVFLKVVVEFKDIKEVEFSDFKDIVKKLALVDSLDFSSYKVLIDDLQKKAGYDFL